MRCWGCDRIILLPDIIGGEPGTAGQIRAGKPKPELTPQTVTLEFGCPHCGNQYRIQISRMPGKGKRWVDQPNGGEGAGGGDKWEKM